MTESCTAEAAAPVDGQAMEQTTAEQATALRHDEAIRWIESEFPDWAISIDVTAGWNGVPRELWQAERHGHHPQRELTAGKLYRRLDDYEDRERQRRALAAKLG